MRCILIVIILLTFASNVISQDIVSTNTKKQYLLNSQIKLTTAQITENFRSVDESWLRYDLDSEPVPFESAYNLKVFDFFELNDQYDSDLKKEVFKQTIDYKTLLDSLKKIKFTYLNSIYYQKGFNSVGGESFEMENNNSGEGYQVNYDIQKKGFFIGIGEVLPYHCSRAFCPKVIEDVEFKQLTITKKYNLKFNSEKSYTQYVFIPMDANTALEIENNRRQVEILRVFNFTDIYTVTFNDADFISDNHGRACKVKVLKGGAMRLLIYSNVTDKVYFEKLFPAVPTK
jgi:hypothetical protein